ncbi:MAG: hypothetical protein RR598_10880 [Anaerorhabdus sp.]
MDNIVGYIKDFLMNNISSLTLIVVLALLILGILTKILKQKFKKIMVTIGAALVIVVIGLLSSVAIAKTTIASSSISTDVKTDEELTKTKESVNDLVFFTQISILCLFANTAFVTGTIVGDAMNLEKE